MADTSSAHGYGALFVEEEAKFATEPVGGITTYLEIKSWTDNRTQGYHDNDVVKQGLQQHTSGVVGVKSDSEAELEMYMHGYSTSTPVTAPATTHPDSLLAGAALGGVTYGGYDSDGIAIGGGSTESNLVLTDASTFESGQAVLVNGEVGWVGEVSTYPDSEELALLHNLRAVPDDEDVVYGAITCFPVDDFSAVSSLAFKWAGLRDDDVVKYLGCRPNSLTIEGAPKDFLTMKMGLSVATWERANTGGDPEPQTYAYPSREQIVGARLLIQDNDGVLDDIEADCSKFMLNANLGIAPKTDLNAASGVSEWRKTATEFTLEVDPVQGIETTSAGWEYIFENQSKFTVVLQVGTTAGRVISICMPAGELVEFPATTDRDGLNAKSLKFRGMAHSRCTGSEGDAYPTNKTCMIAYA